MNTVRTQIRNVSQRATTFKMHLIFDFDGTITKKDTIATLAEAGIAAQRSRNGSNLKSTGEVDRLVHGVLKAPDFDASHFKNFTSIKQETQRLDEYGKSSGEPLRRDAWRKASVKIKLPMEGVKVKSEAAAPEFVVQGIWHRPLLEVVKSAYTNKDNTAFHAIPFQLSHNSSCSYCIWLQGYCFKHHTE